MSRIETVWKVRTEHTYLNKEQYQCDEIERLIVYSKEDAKRFIEQWAKNQANISDNPFEFERFYCERDTLLQVTFRNHTHTNTWSISAKPLEIVEIEEG